MAVRWAATRGVDSVEALAEALVPAMLVGVMAMADEEAEALAEVEELAEHRGGDGKARADRRDPPVVLLPRAVIVRD